MRNVKIFRLFFVQLLIIGFFANSLLPQACFCGEACLHGLQGETKARLSFPFHARCSGNQCKSCNWEDVQTLKALIAAHSKEKLKTLKTPFIFILFSGLPVQHQFDKDFFLPPNKCVKVQSPPTYLQNLSLLL